MKHAEIIDLKALKQDVKITNVKTNQDGENVKWNNDGSITWMRFEKSCPDTIKYNGESPFKEIEVVRNMRQNVTLKAGYILPEAFKARVPVSKAKFDDLMA